MAESAELLQRGTMRGRLVLATVVIGSGIAFLDGSVITIALKPIGVDLDASLAELQWVINGYMLTLASLILVGGTLGDRLGRRRVYLFGVVGFALASGVCALAQNPEQLVAARAVQGVFAALLTPGSLAILQASFRPEDRSAVIGSWAGMSGIAGAVGPFVGGFLLDHGSWRLIFAINLPLCVAVLLLGSLLPESRDEQNAGRFDTWGAVACVAALGGATYLLTSWRDAGTLVLVLASVVTVAGVVAFALVERRPGAMMPLTLFTSRVFSAANGMTFLVYGALGASIFFLVLQLQVTTGYTPLESGIASLPITVALLFLSSRAAVIAQRTGPRLPMSIGPVVCAVGVLMLVPIGDGTSYWLGIFPGMVVFGLGLSTLVSPLTAAVLAAAPDRYAGTASGINNAVARTGSLFAVAALPAAVGLAARDYTDPTAMTHGYHLGLVVCAVLLTGGGIVSWFGLAPHPDLAELEPDHASGAGSGGE